MEAMLTSGEMEAVLTSAKMEAMLTSGKMQQHLLTYSVAYNYTNLQLLTVLISNNHQHY